MVMNKNNCTPVETIAVIGAGTMGHGIAQVAAVAGYRVRLTDARPAALEAARSRIEAGLDRAVTLGKLRAEEGRRARGLIEMPPSVECAVEDAAFCIEAVVEDLDTKRSLFAELESRAPTDAVLASNTSSLPIGSIAAKLQRPQRVIGMHFFNPVPVMKLVEVVVHDGTDDNCRDRTLTLARAFGKEPIVVRDSPGFASSRLGIALGLEAMRMLEAGVATAADIDKAMELGYRHPMGPLRLTDLVGLDVRLAIAEHLERELGERFQPPRILRKKVEAGELGKKTGRGFYDWSEEG